MYALTIVVLVALITAAGTWYEGGPSLVISVSAGIAAASFLLTMPFGSIQADAEWKYTWPRLWKQVESQADPMRWLVVLRKFTDTGNADFGLLPVPRRVRAEIDKYIAEDADRYAAFQRGVEEYDRLQEHLAKRQREAEDQTRQRELQAAKQAESESQERCRQGRERLKTRAAEWSKGVRAAAGDWRNIEVSPSVSAEVINLGLMSYAAMVFQQKSVMDANYRPISLRFHPHTLLLDSEFLPGRKWRVPADFIKSIQFVGMHRDKIDQLLQLDRLCLGETQDHAHYQLELHVPLYYLTSRTWTPTWSLRFKVANDNFELVEPILTVFCECHSPAGLPQCPTCQSTSLKWSCNDLPPRCKCQQCRADMLFDYSAGRFTANTKESLSRLKAKADS